MSAPDVDLKDLAPNGDRSSVVVTDDEARSLRDWLLKISSQLMEIDARIKKSETTAEEFWILKAEFAQLKREVEDLKRQAREHSEAVQVSTHSTAKALDEMHVWKQDLARMERDIAKRFEKSEGRFSELVAQLQKSNQISESLALSADAHAGAQLAQAEIAAKSAKVIALNSYVRTGLVAFGMILAGIASGLFEQWMKLHP